MVVSRETERLLDRDDVDDARARALGAVASASNASDVIRNTHGGAHSTKIVAALALGALGALGCLAGRQTMTNDPIPGAMESEGARGRGARGDGAGERLGVAALGERAPRRAMESSDAGATSEAVDYSKMNPAERRAAVLRDLNGKREGEGLPTFLHVPKTGGTMIESALGSLGIAVGFCHKRPYEFRSAFVGFEPWHTPPRGVVPDSWAILRDPYTRAQSDFLWRTSWEDKDTFAALRTGYDPENCVAFEQHVARQIAGATKSELRKCYQRRQYAVEGMNECDETFKGVGMGVNSHWLPQSVMAASAARLFKFEDCLDLTEKTGTCTKPRAGGKQDNLVKFLRERYHPAVSLEGHINEWNPVIGKPDLEPCWAHMSPKVLNDFNELYAHDFNAFGYATKTSRANETTLALGLERFPARPASVDRASTLGEIERSLPDGRVAQQNVSPAC